jgi:thiol-disulfide isomerase/thioredoxin
MIDKSFITLFSMRRLLLALSLFCSLTAFAGGPFYTVTGIFAGKSNGMAYMMLYEGKGVYNYIDSARIVKGRFVMKGSVMYPKYVLFSVNHKPPQLGFWLENSNITIKAHIDSLNRAVVSGSATQLEYEEARAFLAPYDENCRVIGQEMTRRKNQGDVAGAKIIERSLDSCWQSKVKATIAYIRQKPSSFVRASLIKGISYALNWQQLEELIDLLPPAVAATGEVNGYRERIAVLKATDKGTKAPDFTQNDPEGRPVRLYDKLKSHKVLLLDFWAAWCGPCRRENPNIVAVYKDFHAKGFDVLSVSLDKTKEAWVKAIKDDGLPWTHVSNLQYWNNPVVELYGISSVPANVLIGSDGTILARNLKGDALRDKVRALLSPDAAQHTTPYEMLDIQALPAAQTVVTGYLINDQKAALVTGKDSLLSVYDIKDNTASLLHSIALAGDVVAITIADADNDGKNEIVVATGRRGYDKNTPVRLYVVKYNEGNWKREEIYSKASERPQVTNLSVNDYHNTGRNEIVLSYFDSKYFVETVTLSNNKSSGKWPAKVAAHERMAMARDVYPMDGGKRLVPVVGRPYGDSIGALGDAYLSGAEKKLLPTYRGVKVVRTGDGDNDGRAEIYVGDGWHQDYGKMARGRLAVVTEQGDAFNYELIEDVKGEYEISQIEIADIDGDGKNEVLARGNKYFRIYRKNGANWQVYTDTALPVTPFTTGDLNGDGRREVIFSGATALQVYDFSHIPFSSHLGQAVRTELVDPAALVGQPAPELRMQQWLSAPSISLQSLKGKVVILDFWATWCKPCIKMFPKLREWQSKYREQGLQVLGLTKVDNTQSAAKIKAFSQKENFPYPIGISEESFNNLAYGVGGIPHLVLIDKRGIIRKYEVGVRDDTKLEDEIVKLLGE